MILVKNPTGCNQALSFVVNVKEPTTLVFALNDRYADSTDVSWIWDVDYSKLNDMGAVSYTHLDVYKRQRLAFLLRSLSTRRRSSQSRS